MGFIKWLIWLVVVVVIVVVIGYLYMISGVYNVAATEHHSALVAWFLDAGMTASVEHHAKGITVPVQSTMADTLKGFSHFNDMCVPCHGGPGIGRSEFGQGLYPHGPDLSKAEGDWTAAQLFWIIKHGVKDTGMPEFASTHSDEQIWHIVAFLRHLPQLSYRDYMNLQDSLGTAMPEEHED
jgi:mono/diheme cytochrome c family protein